MCKLEEHYGNCDEGTRNNEYCIFHKPNKDEKDAKEFYRKFLERFKPRVEEIGVDGGKKKRFVFEDDLKCQGFVFPEIPNGPIEYTDKDGNKWEGKFSFEYALFKKDCKFYRARLSGINFSNAQFLNKVSFFDARFYSVIFKDAIFKGYVDFGTSQFYGISNFRGAKFKNGASFRGAYFKKAEFQAAEFTGHTKFTGATLDNASFDSATFKGIAEFYGTTFRNMATFRDTTFNQQVYFSEDSETNKPAVFEGQAIFERAKFLRKAYFERTEFKSIVGFRKARFNALANFYRATFEGEVNTFSGITFGGDVQFSEVTFKNFVSFQGSTFEGTAQFIETIFEEESNFLDCVFSKLVTFYNAVFKGNVIFKGTTFERIALFTGKPDKEKYKFYADLDFSNCDVYKGVEIDIPSEWFKLSKAEAEARRIQKISYERLGLYSKADEMLVKYKRVLRREKSNLHAFLEWLFLDLPSEYLTNPKKVIYTSVIIIIAFSIMYWIGGYYSEHCWLTGGLNIQGYVISNGNICIGTLQKPSTGKPIQDLLNSLYYSIVTFTTLGYGDINPTGIMKALSSLEALLGALLIATLVSIGVQKITR
ncbi:hypothetical protein PAP_05885 [Palaeococcus pacificus DY20341]|uniref:Potassium channel domain-containing protein n=1 Tax=Palaeococcus pacificus DY20341 TaxID=1343739 RepID=A0A075LUC0_9EURY|nr:pentapeptide repeat-containing protein [Palaeococcus pacificus]AIF69577.1 hypothetical protein PAP_05885 [Palaeococcus pacificus DY20341]